MKELLKELQKLHLPQDQYAIYGSGPMAIRKIRPAKDLDVIVTDNLFQKLKQNYSWEKKLGKYSGRIKLGRIEIYPASAWEPQVYGLANYIKRAESIDRFKFVRLDDLIKCKKMMGGEKHLSDIKLIKKYLKS